MRQPPKLISEALWAQMLALPLTEGRTRTQISDRHVAFHHHRGSTLLVTFEEAQDAYPSRTKLALKSKTLTEGTDASYMSVVTNARDWFRDPGVRDYFDELADEAFFDAYDRVVFYGADMCGYAAAAYSLAAPGATVVLVDPQASLDPALTRWDQRFPESRSATFTGSYGYAPEMIVAAEKCLIIHNNDVPENAVHAAMFRRANTMLYAVAHLDLPTEMTLLRTEILQQIIHDAMAGTLTRGRVGQAMRLRRHYGRYLRAMFTILEGNERTWLLLRLCRHVTHQMHAPMFQKKLEELEGYEELRDLDKIPAIERMR